MALAVIRSNDRVGPCMVQGLKKMMHAMGLRASQESQKYKRYSKREAAAGCRKILRRTKHGKFETIIAVWLQRQDDENLSRRGPTVSLNQHSVSMLMKKVMGMSVLMGHVPMSMHVLVNEVHL